MNHPWLLVFGCAMLGFIVIETIGAATKAQISVALDIFSMVCFALIAGAFVL